MRALLRILLTGLSLGSVVAFAQGAAQEGASQEAARKDLPPLAQVRVVLDRDPGVLIAHSQLGLQAARRDGLALGSQEFIVRGDAARRSVDGMDGQGAAGYREWGLALERAVRLPGKARLDRALGDAGLELAELALGDARHEAARALLDSWMSWLSAQSQARVWQEQAQLAAQLTQIAHRRLQAGDASRMELGMAGAAQAQVDAAWALARSQAETALAELQTRFPDLQVDPGIVLLPVEPLPDTLQQWRQRVLAESHELLYARAQAVRAQIELDRIQAERQPDPSIGLRLNSERGGAEQVAGVFVSIPLAGAYRETEVRAAAARRDILERQAAAVERKLITQVNAGYAQLTGVYRAWLAGHDAAQRLAGQAALSQRAYELGETGMTELLVARQSAADAALEATSLLSQAAASRYRLLLDAHMLWPLDRQGDPDHPGARH